MKSISILLAVSLSVAGSEETGAPEILEPPQLSTSDLAWMEGISFTKGILPWEEKRRIGSVSLVIEYENQKRETLIEPLTISYPDADPKLLQSQIQEVLVARRITDGKFEFFLGWTRGSYKISKKKSISLKGVGGMSTSHFGPRTRRTDPAFSYVVPVGESEIFTFLTTQSKPLARIIVVSEAVNENNDKASVPSVESESMPERISYEEFIRKFGRPSAITSPRSATRD